MLLLPGKRIWCQVIYPALEKDIKISNREEVVKKQRNINIFAFDYVNDRIIVFEEVKKNR
jgi:hypothetical protein